MRYNILIFILNFICLASIIRSQGVYPIKNFKPSDYKAGNQNIDFAQNKGMNIFVANNLGILSYNGSAWDLISFESGKKKRSLDYNAKTNRLYIGLQGDFGYLNENKEFVSFIDIIPKEHRDFDEVWDVFVLDDEVYFCTFENIYVYNADQINVITNSGGFDKSFKVDDDLYTQSKIGELFKIKNGKLIAVAKEDHGLIAGIIKYNEGYIIFHQSGVIETINIFNSFKIITELEKELKGTFLNHVKEITKSNWVVSTQTSGIFIVDIEKKLLEQINIDNGLLSNACLRSFQDYSGNLWVGMQNGIALIDINSPVKFTREEINISGSGYEAFETDAGVYYTTSNGIYLKKEGFKKASFLKGTEGPSYSITEISGKLYASHHTGLFLLNDINAEKIVSTNGMWKVKRLNIQNDLVIGGTYEGLFLFSISSDGILKPLYKIKGFSESSRFFEEDDLGRIWVGQFYKGLFCLKFSADYKELSSLEVSDIDKEVLQEQVILSKINNRIHFGTSEGIYYLDSKNDFILKSDLFKKDIRSQSVYLLHQDSEDNIYVYTDSLFGIYNKIGPNNFGFELASLYEHRFSYNNDLLQVSTNVNNGLLINANEGFINYFKEIENYQKELNPLIISSITNSKNDNILYTINPLSKTSHSDEIITLSNNNNDLQFNIDHYVFQNIENQEYAYFLEGLDKDYSPWTKSKYKEFTNLKEGNYAFKVKTKDEIGNITESESLQFKIDTPFYKSAIAKLIYFILTLMLLYMVSKYQKTKYTRKAEAIKFEKERALKIEQKKLEEMEAQNKIKIHYLEEERMKSELTHLNKMLASSTMNLVVKNEFIIGIKEKINSIKLNNTDPKEKKALQQIINQIDSTLRIKDDWEDFEYHFNKVHGDFLKRVRTKFDDLSPNDQKLCAFLRLNLNTKEIANIMSISLRGVEVARYRLRKKLNLTKGENLSKFILQF